jgi:hypothetical protein
MFRRLDDLVDPFLGPNVVRKTDATEAARLLLRQAAVVRKLVSPQRTNALPPA